MKPVKYRVIPSHIGISGNERADAAAKAALSSSLSNAMKCPATDFYHNLAIHCQGLWQAEWDGCGSNKLYSVKPSLGYCNFTHLNRRDAVILRRPRIGHTRLTHQYLLQPPCTSDIIFKCWCISQFFFTLHYITWPDSCFACSSQVRCPSCHQTTSCWSSVCVCVKYTVVKCIQGAALRLKKMTQHQKCDNSVRLEHFCAKFCVIV